MYMLKILSYPHDFPKISPYSWWSPLATLDLRQPFLAEETLVALSQRPEGEANEPKRGHGIPWDVENHRFLRAKSQENHRKMVV